MDQLRADPVDEARRIVLSYAVRKIGRTRRETALSSFRSVLREEMHRARPAGAVLRRRTTPWGLAGTLCGIGASLAAVMWIVAWMVSAG